MKGFIKMQKSSEASDLRWKYPNAFLLLSLIAERASRADNLITGLKQGEALMGDFKKAGLTHQNIALP